MTKSTAVSAADEALTEFRKAVREVNQLDIKKKSAKVRLLKEHLDKLSVVGFTQEKVVEVMAEEGLEMSLGYLKTTLWRDRSSDESKPKG